MLDKAAILKDAQKYLAKGALDKAISELERLVKESPDGNTYNMIGDIYLRKGTQKSAIEHYQKAAMFFRQEGFSQKAQALYKKVLNINPADTDALIAFGEICEEKGMLAEAIKYYLVVADLLAKEGKKEKILDVYAKILSLSPANIPLRIKVADIYIKEGLKSDAASEFVHIARIHDEKGDMQKAREFFQKTIDLQPLNKEATLGLNSVFEKTGELRQAMEQMKEAMVLFPEDLGILFRCAELAVITDNTDLAVKCLLRISEKEPKNIKARRMLGELYLKASETGMAWAQYLPILDEVLLDQKFEDAISFLTTFRSIEPIETGKRLVSLYKQLNEDDRAVTELISMGDLYAEKGMEDDARSCYAEAEQINPLHADVRKRLAPSDLEFEPVMPEPTIPEIEIPDTLIQEPVIEREAPSIPEINIFDEPIDLPETIISDEPLSAEPAEPILEQFEFPAVGKKAEPESITIRAEKAFDEVITEADIFSRYGLLSEAQRLLEGLKQRFPDSIDIHMRLKSVYTDTHNKEAAVAECIILNELYRHQGDDTNAEQVMKDALNISPEDPRLAEQGFAHLIEQTSFSSRQPANFAETVSSRELDIEDYEEEIAEADFYSRQGLATEAIKILEKLQKLFPENKNINERLNALGQTGHGLETDELAGLEMHDAFDMPETVEGPSTFEIPGIFGSDEEPETSREGEYHEAFELPDKHEMFDIFEEPEKAAAPAGEVVIEEQGIEEPVTASIEEVKVIETAPVIEATFQEEFAPVQETAPKAAEPPKETEFENFSFSDDDLMDAQEMPEPALDNDVLEIFQEFKKGIEKELGDADSETHYNLGIAYKEMGLVDDAIKEFQTSRSDPARFIQSSTMLGVCYMEKGLYPLAIDVLNKASLEMKEKDDSYWALIYELAEAHEKNKNLKEALDLYTGVYGWSAKFRDVSDKMSQLRAQAPPTAEKEREQAKEKPKERKDRVSYL
ncbi:MAG: tetratricopeptide repeat protein [Nitrospirae bacterium]|nr:tetratricopeptide repeat protein [Nitrospirota bacterium]